MLKKISKKASFKKTSTLFSLLIILSTFLATPVTAMAKETTNIANTNTSSISKDDKKRSSIEKDSNVQQSKSKVNGSISKQKVTSTSKTLDKSGVKTSPAKSRAPSLQASKDWGDKFITNAELDDANGHKRDHFDIYDDMKARWNFNIPAGTDIKSGDTMTVNIPDVLTLKKDVKFDIKDKSGKIIGHAVADHKTGKVIVTLTDYAEQSSKNGIIGDFNVWVNWDVSKVEQNTTVPVQWGNSGSTDVNIDPGNGTKPDPNEKLYKWGWYDENDPTIIHWRVRVNYAKVDIQNAVYTDSIGANQKLISGSIGAYHIKFTDESEKNFDITSLVPASDVHEDSATKFHVDLHHLNDIVYVDYSTQTTDKGKSEKYKNSGELTGDNIEKQSVDVYSPKNGGGGKGETTKTIQGKKTWDDNNNQDGKRPDLIKIHLLANGKEVATKEVTAKDDWKYSFKDLKKYTDDGKEIKYTIVEDKVTDYNTHIDGYNLTNSYTPGKTSVTVTKHWDDKNDKDRIRPGSIKVQLYADGKAVGEKIVLNNGNKWTKTWNDLPQKKDGKDIVYTVKEVGKVDGYEATVSGGATGNIIITNKHTPKPDTPVNPNTPVTPNTPVNPNTPVTPNTPQGKVVPVTPGNKGKNNLPSTAAQKQQLKTIGYGLTVMAGLFMIGAWLLRRKNN